MDVYVREDKDRMRETDRDMKTEMGFLPSIKLS